MTRLVLAAALAAASLAPAARATGGVTAEGLEGAGTPIPLVGSAFTLLGAYTPEQALDNLAAAGVRAIRQDFLWQRIEPYPREYDFAAEDALVDAAAARGIEVIAILAYGNPLYSRAGAAARDAGTGGGIPPFGVGASYLWPPDPEHLDAYRAFARALADHFAGRVRRYEVWNEENVGWRFWPPHEDAAAYGALLREGAAGLREGDPDAIVSVGGVFYPEIPPGLPEEGGLRYLGKLWDAHPGTAASVDAVAWHPYPYPFVAPEVVLPGNSSVPGSADQVRAFLAGRGAPDEELWVTEVGWPTHREYGVTREKQAAYLVRALAGLWAEGVRVAVWYTYADGPSAEHNQEDAFGLFAFDGAPKPSYLALETFTSLLGNATLAGALADVPEGVRALVFETAGTRTTMLWTAPETLGSDWGPMEQRRLSVEVTLPVDGAAVELVTLVGARAPLAPSGGTVSVTVTERPAYVVETR